MRDAGDITFLAADSIDPARLHEAFGSAFSDYLLGPFALPIAQWPVFLGRQAADLSLSRVATRGGAVLAFALVAPRPELGLWRLATMGALPAARGSGAAPALLDDFIARAAAAGACGVELECFAQNERAVRLYRGRGFETLHPLHGYVRAPGASSDPEPPAEAPRVVDLASAYAWLEARNLELGDLPLQVTPPSLKAQPLPYRAWRRGDAQLVFAVNEPAGVVTLHSLVDCGRGQRDAKALLAQLVDALGRLRIVVPQLQRPDLGGDALAGSGFERQPLHQLLMRRMSRA